MEHTTQSLPSVCVEDAVGRERRYRAFKRGFDLCCTLVVLPFAIAVMVVLALAVRIDSPGPVVFSHRRVGWRGRSFTLYKFRTMLKECPPYAPHPEGRKGAGVTRVGRFLRRTNLDELPQLVNVLRGDMSLVGPRPEMPHIVAAYTAEQRLRLLVKPGLTGLWQISKHRGLPIHEHMEHDLAYLRGMCLRLDVSVMVRTLPLLVHGDKAEHAPDEVPFHG